MLVNHDLVAIFYVANMSNTIHENEILAKFLNLHSLHKEEEKNFKKNLSNNIYRNIQNK